MFVEGICPICEALRDPETNKCLRCGKNYEPITEKEIASGERKDFLIPLKENNTHGYYLSVDGSFEIDLNDNNYPVKLKSNSFSFFNIDRVCFYENNRKEIN